MIGSLNVVRTQTENKTSGNEITAENLNNITNNYVKQIECLCLDEFNLSERNALMNILVQKLCIGGTLSLKFINLNLVSNKISKSELTGEKFSSLLPNLRSCLSDQESTEIIKNMPVVMKGLYYDNIYSIMSLEKI